MLQSAVVDHFKTFLKQDQIVTNKEELLCYQYGAGGYPATDNLPLVVVFVESADDVAGVLKFANEHKILVVTRGQATGLNQGIIPVTSDSIVISTKRLQGIEVDTKTLTATVGAGVVNSDIKDEVAKYGLFYPPDPSSYTYSSIGGNAASNAGGLQCVKYGTTKDYVLGLEVVLPSGAIIHTGGKCVKNTAGYNLTQLFVGSEGTLGVITKVILKLRPKPEAKRTMLAVFDDVEKAARAVSTIMVAGVMPSIMEFMDNTFIRAVEDFAHAGLPTEAAAILLMEVDGPDIVLDAEVETIRKVCDKIGITEFRLATTEEEVERFWTARRAVLPALARVAKGRYGGDPAVPIDRLADVIHTLHALGDKYNLKTAVTGHAGDGNIHPNIFFNSPEEKERAGKCRTELHMEIIKMGGTVAAEHGIGRIKLDWMRKQLGEDQYEIMWSIKRCMDPNNIMNTGCVLAES